MENLLRKLSPAGKKRLTGAPLSAMNYYESIASELNDKATWQQDVAMWPFLFSLVHGDYPLCGHLPFLYVHKENAGICIEQRRRPVDAVEHVYRRYYEHML